MFRPQCLIVLAALTFGVAQSNVTRNWDIAITTGNHLEFYKNQTKVNNASNRFNSLTALAYDAVHNMLLFVDSQNDNASIFSFYLNTKKYQSLVRKKSVESIQGLAFDPLNSLLFWTDSFTKSIFSMSLKHGSTNSAYGNLLIQMDDEIPRGIAVDSCRGYIYWTNTNITKPTIERARFDGSNREVIVSTDIYMPVDLVIDQRTKRLYWIDDKEGIHFSIESSDLDGNSRKILYTGIHNRPNALTVSNDSLYWVDHDHPIIWKLHKNAKYTSPEEYISYNNEVPFGIAALYSLKDQTGGVEECEALSNLMQNVSAINDSFSVPPDMGLFCVHGVKVVNKLLCHCAPGYTGERCDISVCQNYCFQGDCSVSSGGQPSCRCKEGFFGERCEMNVCSNYCLNYGHCSLDKDHKPVCRCATDFEGPRCENITIIADAKDPFPIEVSERTTQTTETNIGTEPSVSCNCENATKSSILASDSIDTRDEFVVSCSEGWDAIRDPIIMVLGILCGLLVLTSVVLCTKILQLKKRPRIKKRIIVNKNVTPLTARPDQCEITIENCCNMNICETPCFEPRSNIRPTLVDSKQGKEEKKNLIANMELPDDY